MSQIVDVVTDALVTYLAEKLITNIPVNDPARATLVRGGRLQDDPTKHEIFALVQAGDPEERSWRHGLNSVIDNAALRLADTFEIGGASLWWYRMSIQWGCYFIKKNYDRDAARQHAHEFFGRLKYWTQHAAVERPSPILGLSDSFGETAVMLLVSEAQHDEGGGPPKDLIWRGRLRFDVLTHHDW